MYLPKNTVAAYKAISATQKFKVDHLPLPVMAGSTKAFRMYCGLAHPDREALSFYALNHCLSLVRERFTDNEPLPLWAENVVSEYIHTLEQQAVRLTHYIVSITTREFRHSHAISSALSHKITNLGGAKMVECVDTLRGLSEGKAVEFYMNTPPEVSIGQYVGVLALVFNEGKWSGGYGGKPWGQIAETLLSFVQGHTSLEMLVDTAYTLAHNNGPMFNKGMMYDNYSSNFKKILDLQRGGQVPEGILYGAIPSEYVSDMVRAVIVETQKALPSVFGEYVDWVKVQSLGALGNYYYEIEEQKKKKVPKSVVYMGKPATTVGDFTVMPGIAVPVYQRKVA